MPGPGGPSDGGRGVLVGYESSPGDQKSLRHLWLAIDDVARVIRPPVARKIRNETVAGNGTTDQIAEGIRPRGLARQADGPPPFGVE